MKVLLLAAVSFLVGCHDNHARIQSRIELAERPHDLSDHYASLDRSAWQGVDNRTLKMALSGDGKVALALGEEFAEMNRKSEARYWYQISSENGNGIAMNNLANLLRESDCERANFWLAKALKSEELPDEIDRSINEEMPKYLEDCR